MRALLALSLLVAPAAGALAQTFDAADDFSTTQNANGAWSYGRKALAPTDAFALNTATGNFFSVGPGWQPAGQSRPFVGLASTTAGAAIVGEVFLHPGVGGGENVLAVLRWTAPTAGSVTIDGSFFTGDAGRTDHYVYQNASPLLTSLDQSGNTPFSLTSTVAAGDTLDFMVGFGTDGANSDTTPVTARIVLNSAVPEPATMAALGLGAAALLRRRRKSN